MTRPYLGNPKYTIEVLQKYNFAFQKRFGQNFLIDTHVLEKIIEASKITKDDFVLEIGPGIGTMTQYLAEAAREVVAVEIDKTLIPILENDTLKDWDNVTVINEDILKVDIAALAQEKNGGKPIKVVANLPYYITSPIIMMLLENELPIDEIVVMVQKEAGERLCAEVGTRQAGAVSVAVNFYASGEILFDVPRESFMPSPKVDSVVIKLVLNDEDKYQIENKKKFFSLVKCAFAQRRKTALNSISNTMGVYKQKITEIFTELGLEINIRPEKLTMQNLIDITDRL